MLGILKNTTITKGFVLAGLFNMTVLVFSRFFTNPVIPESDPVVMSNFGLVMIVVWGLAYISVSKNYPAVKWLVAVFAVEKLIYGIVWTKWNLNHELSAVYAKDTMAGIFYTIYGLNDWIFFIFFSYVFLRLMLYKNSQKLRRIARTETRPSGDIPTQRAAIETLNSQTENIRIDST